MYKIGTFNKISPVGLGKLTDNFALVEDQNEANGIILRSYDMHEMDFSDNLLAIGRAGAGTNNIPVDRCAQQGIVVFNSPGANANAVKELCLAGMIMAARNIPAGIAWAKTLVGSEGVGKQIEKGKGQFAGTEILGKTLGVIGLGAIGRLVANACVGLGMTVVGYDAFLSDKAKSELDPSITVVDDLNALYPQCDYISIHVPANDSTKGMMNAVAFAQMKDGVKFMNFSRDKLMNDDDLLAALDSGKISTYVTDFADDAILNADKPNIIVLPHLGASSAEAEDNCASMAVTQVMDYLENGNIVNSVNMPAVSLGARKGTRVGVIAKADAAAAVLAKVAELGAADVASATRGDYAYILAEVEADEAAIAIDGVIRVRILK
ncbi:MAG: 3-phosphoglycerate dehydrogenase family protein [Lentihominibacter sp.]|nr:3-phosphoglycerate dehydrogenase family protein [Lentihominibacter sp.]